LTASGCAEWMKDFSPSDYWPSQESWAKWSPSNIWYNLQPSQLDKLNRGPGMPSDVYYSISDPIQSQIDCAVIQPALPSDKQAVPIDEPAAKNAR